MKKGSRLRLNLISSITIYFLSICVSYGQEADTNYLKSTIEVVTTRMESEGFNSNYLRIRGWSYFELGSFIDALRDFDHAISIDDQDSDLYLRRGDINFELGQYEVCIQDYSKAIKLSPDSLSYRISRGVAYERVGNYSAALNDYNYILLLSPSNELVLANRAILYSSILKQYDKAILDWDNLIRLNPNPGYYNDRGLTLMSDGKYQMAIEDYNKAIEIDNQNSKFFFNRGFSFGMLGKVTEAFSDFRRSEELDSENPYLYKYKGEVFMKIGQVDSACKSFEEANRLGLKVDESLLKNCPKH